PSDPKTKTASVIIEIEIGDGVGRKKLDEFEYSVDNISSIEIEIRKTEPEQYDDDPLMKMDLIIKDDKWTGEFAGLPIGINLKFEAKAYSFTDNSEEELLFSGFIIQSLNEGSNIIIIPIRAVICDDEDIPEIINIKKPDDIMVSGATEIVIEAGPAYLEEISYQFIVDENCGSFSPSNGIINLDMDDTIATTIEYTAPDEICQCAYTLILMNRCGSSYTQNFNFNIVESNLGMEVIFCPLIISIKLVQINEDLQISADVTDDKSIENISYEWSFSGGLSFADSLVNPAVLTGYNETTPGDITLIITDEDGCADSFSYAVSDAYEDPAIVKRGNNIDEQTGLIIQSDLTVNDTVVLDKGRFRNIIVLNGGDLTVNENICANNIFVRNGKFTANGNLNICNNIVVEGNSVLQLFGTWHTKDVTIKETGKIEVIASTEYPEDSGVFNLVCENFTIDSEAWFTGDGVGNDPRGKGGGGGDAGKGGGSYGGRGGIGGRGFWTGSHVGEIYGDIHSYTIDKGSVGGSFGGAKIFIISKKLLINGMLTANGAIGVGNHGGGGSGGGILIDSEYIEINGIIHAHGGLGSEFGGGGGGGRQKFFYESGIDINIVDQLNVTGGSGYRDGEDGTIWIDVKPKPPVLISPENNATITEATPTFKFTVIDESKTLDDREDDLTCIIELSADNFVTIYKLYDQTAFIDGWSDCSYLSGDEAEFTPEEELPAGTYYWRATVSDRSVSGKSSEIRMFII
ncbi:hypothetical protein ACFL23_03870, partial [Patescibacteria group bacterium]